ncbi:MAG: actin-related protein Arp4 [Monoraphidium minutum]|nr:MAG: actin-related protein Arp4 [Monoraphidium minutum]
MAANAVYGGDEVNAVVIDLGGCLCRAGYAGDDTPKAVFPAAAGVVQSSEANGAEAGARSIYVGNTALSFKRDHMQVVNAMGPDDLVQDWDVASNLWTHALKDRLGVNPGENAVMLAEPTHNTRAGREKAVEVMFESQACPALFLAKAAVLSAFAVGKQTALVVDAGYRGTTVAAVYEGFVLNKSVTRSALGGALMTRCMQKVLEAELEAKGSKLMARHMFKRVPIPDFAQYETVVEANTNIDPSYDAWGLEQVAADAKESLCKASDAAFNDQEGASMPYALYELPDGTELNVGPDRFRVTETLFQSARVSSFPGMDNDPLVLGRSLLAWPVLVKNAIDGCDGDVRREFWNSIVLTGGTSLVPNVRERLERELTSLAPGGTKVKVNAPVNPTEKRFATWIGGSILSSLGSFQQMWMSKAEFEEHGAGLIHRKSP